MAVYKKITPHINVAVTSACKVILFSDIFSVNTINSKHVVFYNKLSGFVSNLIIFVMAFSMAFRQMHFIYKIK